MTYNGVVLLLKTDNKQINHLTKIRLPVFYHTHT